jgi:hypothetical protein
MLANSSLKIVLAWDQALSPAIRGGRVSAILRAASLAALVGLLFCALACGLWLGMSWSADLSASDQGVTDFTY